MVVYRNDGPWGTGKGANLESLEVDTNFYELEERIQTVEEDPPAGVGIADIQVINFEMFVYLTDGSQFGPFPIPQPITSVEVLEEVSSFTIAEQHVGAYVRVTSASSVVITAPDDTQNANLNVGDILTVRWNGEGSVGFVAGGAANILTPESLTLRKRYSNATIVKVAANTWELSGDLAAL